ncbi:aminoglycoside phosphotransferase family protein [Actinopolymorpha sp. B17G11]|uniref:phosphotransferase family protein n=1 Tax=Actinopolymorpha sp. B17G11 TaxID=3160861 RepID=UPI0032E3E4A2
MEQTRNQSQPESKDQPQWHESAPVARAFDLDSLVAAVAAEGRQVDLAGVVLKSGWENVVLETVDGWILRFPRDDELPFERELAILDRVCGRLPAKTPKVEWTGRHTRFAAYRTLTGASFDAEAYLAASAHQRDALAGSLARFLAAMHSFFSSATVAELGIPRPAETSDPDPYMLIVNGLAEIPAEARPAVERLLADHTATWGNGAVPGPDVVLHNDFHVGNLVLDGPVGEVTGVWDFSCVQIGVPSFDLRYFEDGPADLLRRLAAEYETLSGHRIDLRAATLASRVETVCDALETGTTDTLPAVVARWQ